MKNRELNRQTIYNMFNRDLDPLDKKLNYTIDYDDAKTAAVLVKNGATLNPHHLLFMLNNVTDMFLPSENGDRGFSFQSVPRYPEVWTQILINSKMNINTQDRQTGNTALIWASYKGYKDCVNMLLHANADRNIKNKNDETALDVAVRYGKTACVQLLLETPIYVEEKHQQIKTR